VPLLVTTCGGCGLPLHLGHVLAYMPDGMVTVDDIAVQEALTLHLRACQGL
jgi:hypothetical protein